ncbi:MAG TPA: hypothetical protein VK034_29660 [Enhygromyxa sp.]|nr:hypothetical protein [Enhygromyxa sp.]
MIATLAASLVLGLGCSDGDDRGDDAVGDGDGDGTSSGDGDGDNMEGAEAEAEGDGDPSGDGDGDPSGDGDGDPSGDGDGDGDPSGDGDGDGDGDPSGDGDGDGDPSGDGDGDPTGDGDGDPPPPDSDMDGIPDPDDPFPMDPDIPGQALGNVVYAHTASQLYTMDPNNYQITFIGNFTFNQSSGSVTDIAIDRWGVLYAVTFDDVFVCNPNTAGCYYLGDLPQSFNGLTMVPPGTIDPQDDTLIGIANSGTWYVITIQNQQAQLQNIGQYGGNMTSAGDVFSIQGTGTYGAVNKPGVNNGNVIVESNPLNGNVIAELATLVGYSTVYGLAGWENQIFAFNAGGQVVEVDPSDGSYQQVAATNHNWWGAGVYTILPQ